MESNEMRSFRWNRIGVTALLLMIAVLGSSCTYYYKVMARVNLVDGAQAYNERKFDEAMEKFTKAVEYDPEGTTIESRSAQLFLARTLHSLFAGNRKKKENAEAAIVEYNKALPMFETALVAEKEASEATPEDEKLRAMYEKGKKTVGSIVSAIGSLYENLQQEDKWQAWQLKAADNEALPDVVRANSLVALAAKKYNCANDISDNSNVKKTVNKGSEQVFEFSKPSDEEEFDKLKKCVEEGAGYVDKALKLNNESDSAWSYKASLLVQSMRIAEMDGNTSEKESFKKQSEEAKAKFEALAKIRREKEEAEAAAEAKKLGGEAKGGDEKEEPKEGTDAKPADDDKKTEEKPAEKTDDSESKEEK